MISIASALSNLSLNDKRIISSNNDTFSPSCQQLNKEELQAFLRDPSGYLEAQSPGALKMLNVLLYLSKAYNIVAPSQEKLAYLIGVGRQWANVIIKRLVQAGLLVVKYRHRRTCVYKLSKLFYDPKIRSKIAHFFTALNGWKRALGMIRKIDTTPLIYNDSFIYKRLLRDYLKQKDYRKKEELCLGTVTVRHTLQEEAMKEVSRTIRDFNDFTPDEQKQLSHFPTDIVKTVGSKLYNKPLFNAFHSFRKACINAIDKQQHIVTDQDIVKLEQDNKKETKTGMNKIENKPQSPQSAYMNQSDSRSQREKDWSLFVRFFTIEGNKIRQMLNEQKIVYCYEKLIPRGVTKEEIDRQFYGREMFEVIREAKNCAANDAILEYNKRKLDWQW